MAELKNRQDRDFRLYSTKPSLDFNKIKIRNQTFKNDVVIDVDYYQKMRHLREDKESIERAISNNNLPEIRRYSRLFFRKSGIYSRLCRYMAFMYKYDWYIVPHIYDDKIKDDKVIEGWYKSCCLLERSHLKRIFGEIALQVIYQGCYYGYKIDQPKVGFLQELPVDYCRSRYKINGKPIVEFNVKFFDDTFADSEYKIRVVKMFPKEIQKAYVLYKKGNKEPDYRGDDKGWFPLDPDNTVKFNLCGSDAPLFASVIPLLLDLEEAQKLDREKMRQQLLRIIIQQFPLDKNGDIIFDADEMSALHTNAVNMLGKSIGVEVLSTLADVSVADLSDKSNVTSVDQLDKVERTVYNEAGVSQNQFNTDGNLALEKSIANDEGTMTNLIQQFEEYAETLLSPFNKNTKRLEYKFQILPTTIYNYKELAKLYKEQTMLGFSKLLPQIALGNYQSSIIATALFENEYMNLNELFIAPQMSSTMSSDKATTKKQGDTQSPSTQEVGRPPKDDSEKSEKTIQNIESGG